jgi:hypothetical protein
MGGDGKILISGGETKKQNKTVVYGEEELIFTEIVPVSRKQSKIYKILAIL